MRTEIDISFFRFTVMTLYMTWIEATDKFIAKQPSTVVLKTVNQTVTLSLEIIESKYFYWHFYSKAAETRSTAPTSKRQYLWLRTPAQEYAAIHLDVFVTGF